MIPLNLSSKLSIMDIESKIQNKRIILRVDYNVPIKNNKVIDDSRIKATLETIRYILDRKPKSLIIISHLGRPDGKVNQKYSLQIVADTLSSLIQLPVVFINDCVGDKVEQAIQNSYQGQIFLLENLRFHLEEEGKGLDENNEKVVSTEDEIKEFRYKLSRLGDIYINDAFGTSHRSHSSMVGIECEYRVCGLLIKKELEYFSKVLENPNRPLIVIVGGAKVSDKINLIMNIINIADHIIIGGGMAFTFLHVLNNMKIGNSIFDHKGQSIIHNIMDKANEKNVHIHLPVDFVCANQFNGDENIREIRHCSMQDGIDEQFMGLDIGKESVDIFKQVIDKAQTVVWNGPMGMIEVDQFRQGTMELCKSIIERTQQGALSIIGGGDSVGFVMENHFDHMISHVSTGGGATLELLEGYSLPGVDALDSNYTL